MTLDQIQPGQMVWVKQVLGAGAVRRRLLDMGLVAGVQIRVVKAAPLGDPVEYELRGYHLSLRRAEARLILVETEAARPPAQPEAGG